MNNLCGHKSRRASELHVLYVNQHCAMSLKLGNGEIKTFLTYFTSRLIYYIKIKVIVVFIIFDETKPSREIIESDANPNRGLRYLKHNFYSTAIQEDEFD